MASHEQARSRVNSGYVRAQDALRGDAPRDTRRVDHQPANCAIQWIMTTYSPPATATRMDTTSSLRQQTYFLTTALKDRREGESLASPDNRQLWVLERVATLFTAGTPKGTPKLDPDANVDNVVAVAGVLTSLAIHTTTRTVSRSAMAPAGHGRRVLNN